MNTTIGIRLREELDLRGMTQKELAERTGITEAAISRYLNGTRQPRAVTLAAIADALSISSADLLGEEDASHDELDAAVRIVARNAHAITDEQKRRLINAIMDL